MLRKLASLAPALESRGKRAQFGVVHTRTHVILASAFTHNIHIHTTHARAHAGMPCNARAQGYAPLSIRLVEAAVLRGGWGPITDALSLLPGAHFDVTQSSDEEGRPVDRPTPPAILRQQQQQQAPLGRAGRQRGVGGAVGGGRAVGGAVGSGSDVGTGLAGAAGAGGQAQGDLAAWERQVAASQPVFAVYLRGWPSSLTECTVGVGVGVLIW